MHYAIIDIETTGGSTKDSKITEIAIYKHDGEKVIDVYETLVNPEREIPEFIARLTGIKNSMVVNSPKFYEIAKQIIEFTEDCVFVAHNVAFDYSVVRHEFKLLGYDYRRKHLCTVRSARYVLPGHEKYSLGNLSKALGIQITNRHRAGGDAEATAKLFTILMQTDPKGLATFIQDEVNPKLLHPNLDVDFLDEIPNKTGVYKFYNETNQLIYIGKSKHIKKRIDQHLKNDKTQKGTKMRLEIARIEFEITGSELVALLYESDLIKAHKPIYNRQLRKSNFAYGIFTFFDQSGYIHLHADTLAKNPNLPITTFSSRKEATDFIHYLVEKHQLCNKLCGVEKTSNSCFGFQVKKCFGACVSEETTESYNERVDVLINQLTFDEESFFIIENGRTKQEKAVVLIENGSYQGFGFVPYFLLKKSPTQWKKAIEFRKEDKDARTILRFYLRKYPETMKRSF